MHVGGSYVIAAEPAQVWAALHDAASLRSILPGCESAIALDDKELALSIRRRVGPIEELFAGSAYFSDEYPVETFVVTVNVQSPTGMIRGQAQICTEEGESDNTILFYDGEVDFGGRLAGLPPRLLETTANGYVRLALESLSREMGNIPERYFHSRLESSADHVIAGTRQSASRNVLRWLPFVGLAATLLLAWQLVSEWRLRRFAGRIAKNLRRQDAP